MEKEVKNNVENKVERPQNKHLKPLQPGETANPNGRPKGQRNYATIYAEAMQILADKNSSTPEKLEAEMVANAAVLARKGDYRFYKDFMDRLHGTPTNRTELTGKNGEKLIESVLSKEEKDKLLGLLN